MPDFCTCGAELPPDARFYHKCGKPQREEDVIAEQPAIELPTPPVEPAVVVAPVSVQIGFRNPLAFRISLFTSLVALFLNVLLVPGFPVWLTAAGFLGVHLYRRRTGASVSVRSGAKLGWITGVLSFVIAAIPLTFVYVEQISRPDYLAQMRDQLNRFEFPPAMRDQMLATMQTPTGIATQVITSLVILFVIFTLFPLLGGALGAKMLGKAE